MASGFKNVQRCVEDVSNLKDMFQEIVGIMTGERIRFLDHSDENVSPQDAQNINNNDSTSSSSDLDYTRRMQQYRRMEEDTQLLRTAHSLDRIGPNAIKQETSYHVPLFMERGRAGPSGNHDATIGEANETTTEPNVSSSNTASATLMEQARNYKINRALYNVIDLAREYYEGFPGKPSVMLLERRFGASWRRDSKDRVLFTKRKCIINKIDEIVKNPEKFNLPTKISRKSAIKVVENIRLGNNKFRGHACRLSLSQLYEYFSKKQDTPDDYSLELKVRGVETRRVYLMRERDETRNDIRADSSSSTSVASSTAQSIPSTSESAANTSTNANVDPAIRSSVNPSSIP